MSLSLRKEVLKCFKSLQRTRQSVFCEDVVALEAGRKRINEEFKKYIHVSDVSAIVELIQLTKSVESELKSTIIQAKEVAPGKYEVRITPDTAKLDNIPFAAPSS